MCCENNSLDNRLRVVFQTVAANRLKAYVKQKTVKVFPEYEDEVQKAIRIAAANTIKARIIRGIAIWV